MAVLAPGYFGVNPPAFVGQVMASPSAWSVVVLLRDRPGHLLRRRTATGAVAGIFTGITLTALHTYYAIFEEIDHWLGLAGLSSQSGW